MRYKPWAISMQGNSILFPYIVDMTGDYFSRRREIVEFIYSGDMGRDIRIDTSSEENKGILIDFIFL